MDPAVTRHVPGEQREPRGCLGTAGGAERSRKGSHPATKGVRGVRGRPGEGAREGLQPHFGAGGSPSPGVRSSWCHFVTSLPLQRHPAGCWSCRAAVETSPVPGPSPLSRGHTGHHTPVLPGETEAPGQASPEATPNPPGSAPFPDRRQNCLWGRPGTNAQG